MTRLLPFEVKHRYIVVDGERILYRFEPPTQEDLRKICEIHEAKFVNSFRSGIYEFYIFKRREK